MFVIATRVKPENLNMGIHKVLLVVGKRRDEGRFWQYESAPHKTNLLAVCYQRFFTKIKKGAYAPFFIMVRILSRLFGVTRQAER